MSELFPNALIHLSFVFCLISAFIILFFTIPLQVKQAGVQNGLAMLRKQLLAFGVVTFTTTTIAAYFLGRLSYSLFIQAREIDVLTQVLLFIFCFSKFLVAMIGYKIYHQQYVLEH